MLLIVMKKMHIIFYKNRQIFILMKRKDLDTFKLQKGYII